MIFNRTMFLLILLVSTSFSSFCKSNQTLYVENSHLDQISSSNIDKDDQRFDRPQQFLLETVRFYQLFVSPIKQNNCPMYPTCSQYGLECLDKYDFKGILMIVDRLNRCGHDLNQYPRVIVDSEIFYLDQP